ncbi:hypothetical protein EHS25_007324, partial [Saitozyma podzolica]
LIICLQEMYGLTIGGADDMTSEQQVAGQVSLELTSLEHELLHYNCLGGDTYFENFEDPQGQHRWNVQMGNAVRYHAHYKWIWLSRGDGTSTTEVVTREDLRFWDERLAGMDFAAGY